MVRRLCALGLFLVLAAGVRADEIRLKDGSKIVGTIVAFENDSFKVQTAYGFALVRKDSIAQIIPSEPAKSGEPAKAVPPAPPPAVSNTSAAASSPSARPEPQPAVARGATSSAAPTPAIATAAVPPAAPRAAAPAAGATVLPMPAPNPRPASPPTPTAASPAPAPAAPAPPPFIREFAEGNLYTNQTYAFQLYRPPGWDLLPEARKALPNAITAMGTTDETTLFVVGREALRDTFEAQATSAERALRQIYENYRPVSSSKRTVAGLPAVEWRFRGVADGHDWSVTALTVARGADVFTLLGMTYADSDLMQIRENVIAKMISSLQFTPAR